MLPLAQHMPAALAQGRKKGIMLMNRIGPSSSDLYITNSDGSGERKFLASPNFDYHPSFSADGKWVLFTSGAQWTVGQSDVFRAKADGTDIRPLITGPSVDDQAALSPDGTRVAFMSTRDGYRANIWVMDVKSGRMNNLTGGDAYKATLQGRTVSGDPPGRLTANGWPSRQTATATGAVMMGAMVGSTRKSSASM